MFRRNLRLILISAGIIGGLVLTIFTIDQLKELLGTRELASWQMLTAVVLGSLIGGLLGFSLFPIVTWMEHRLSKTPLLDILFGAAGLIVGLLIATLLSFAIKNIPWLGAIVAALAALVFGYLGMTIGAKRRDELTGALWGLNPGARFSRSSHSDSQGSPKILDTSVIIDGRVADIVKTGFLEGPVIIPSFVLDELRHIADSSDVLRRNRGRRGLDILAEIQRQPKIKVDIVDEDIGDGEVDTKLVKLAKTLNGEVVTNDYNLNKVAELQGVKVLNINELANALKPAVLPGEEMTVTVIKEGKESGQGVAYLDDGTMIVIDGGKRYLSDTIAVVVTSVLQTAAGRMIFARPRPGERGDRLDHHERERVAP